MVAGIHPSKLATYWCPFELPLLGGGVKKDKETILYYQGMGFGVLSHDQGRIVPR